MAISQFTVCALLYGDHPELAQRCLDPLLRDVVFPREQLRIATNAISDRTKQYLDTKHHEYTSYFHDENKYKYPVMREMIHGSPRITTPYTMWFDDDSYITQPLDAWLPQVARVMEQADIIGSQYSMNWQGQQQSFVRQQPWYAGKDPAERKRIVFVTGGWWTIRTELLYRYDYPWPALQHNGGDTMLGELCYQQGLRMRQFRTGVCINADARGVESASPRRGYSSPPLGMKG